MKVAIVHDWLINYGGAERVLESIHSLFPNAPVYTAVYNLENLPDSFKGFKIYPSFLQKLPFSKTKYQSYLPFMPLAFEEFNFSDYDLVISSSHSCAKGIIVKTKTLHISYVHTPMRYAWDLYHEYMNNEPMGIVKKLLVRPLMNNLRIWDRLSADRVDKFICNSYHVKQRIKKYYRKEAEVIYPPVNTDFFVPLKNPSLDYYLVVSRLVPYKQVDLIVQTFNKLRLKLKIVGMGSEYKRLRRLAKSNIEFLQKRTDEELRDLYANCKALIFAGEEDFGIAPVEAQSAGRPVIAYGKGGVLETVIDDRTGILFYESSIEALASAIYRLETLNLDSEKIRNNALKFDKQIFLQKFLAFVEHSYNELDNIIL